jgi:hypothetical protein
VKYCYHSYCENFRDYVYYKKDRLYYHSFYAVNAPVKLLKILIIVKQHFPDATLTRGDRKEGNPLLLLNEIYIKGEKMKWNRKYLM